jgi:hypothetical protein
VRKGTKEMSQGIDREQLEEAIATPLQKTLLEMTDEICADGFLTNRKRLKLVQELEDFIIMRDVDRG